MAETDISATTTTNLNSSILDFSVTPRVTESMNASGDEMYFYFQNFKKWYGYYMEIPEIYRSYNALATWAVGKGWITDNLTEVEMAHWVGSGQDTAQSILYNLLVTKKFNGDAFAEIVREGRFIVNLKPLSPDRVRIVYGKNGIIKRYDYWNLSGWTPIKKENMFHIMNDRICDEPKGTSGIEPCVWVIDTRQELLRDKRRVHHRSTIRIVEVDTDDTTKYAEVKSTYAEAIKNGEVWLVPKGNYGFPEAPISYIETLDFIQYLENAFYQIIGVPRVIATSENFTEAASKVGLVSFEPVYVKEQLQFEAEIWAQLSRRIEFNKPPSLMDNMQSDEEANTVQTGFQQNDVDIGAGE